MFEFTGLGDMKGWMRAPAGGDPANIAPEPPGTVVISSRVRLARNLSEYPYPGHCPADQEEECRERIIAAFRGLPNAKDFTIVYMDELSSLERRILFERNLISQGYSIEKHRALVLSADESVAGIIGDEDHLRLVGIRTGRGSNPCSAVWTPLTRSWKGPCRTRFPPNGAISTPQSRTSARDSRRR